MAKVLILLHNYTLLQGAPYSICSFSLFSFILNAPKQIPRNMVVNKIPCCLKYIHHNVFWTI